MDLEVPKVQLSQMLMWQKSMVLLVGVSHLGFQCSSLFGAYNLITDVSHYFQDVKEWEWMIVLL